MQTDLAKLIFLLPISTYQIFNVRTQIQILLSVFFFFCKALRSRLKLKFRKGVCQIQQRLDLETNFKYVLFNFACDFENRFGHISGIFEEA